MMRVRTQRAVSVALSLALHTLLLLTLWGSTVAQPGLVEPELLPVRIVDPAPAQPRSAAPAPQEVAKAVPPAELLPPPPEPPKPEAPPEPEQKIPLPEQIVSPPDAGKNEVPPDTRFKSDRDVRVEKEQVKRGEPKPGESAPGEDAPPEPADKPKPPAPQPPSKQQAKPPGPARPPRVAALPKLENLLPDPLVLAQQGYGEPPAPTEESPAQRATRPLNGGGGGIVIPRGPIGTLDYLPDVREGDITLLNTKAEIFAPFVRRVAIRVFQNFLISLRKDLGNLSAVETVQAEAVMDPRSGEMIRFTVLERSARISLASDRRLQQACNVGFFDRNPPPGARWEDGNIHFIFVTELQAQAGPRGPASWGLFLAAGLK